MMQPDIPSKFRTHSRAAVSRTSARCWGDCDNLLFGLAVWTLVHTTEALAGETAPLGVGRANSVFDDHRQGTLVASFSLQTRGTPWTAMPLPPPVVYLIPPQFLAPDLQIGAAAAPHEFRPRRPSLTVKDGQSDAVADGTLMSGTTVWQRLGAYRAHDRVRVITLWETGGSSVSLQAGKRGDPSLQWTSRTMNRDGATRGLLDQLFSVSLRGVGKSLAVGSHAAAADPTIKAAKPADAGAGLTPSK